MKKVYRREKGEMGVGTLIIFIAMIIVAAVAATVLIQTAYMLQQQAMETGDVAIQDVATGFKVITIQGIRSDVIYTNETLGNISSGDTVFTGTLKHVPVNPHSVTITNGTFVVKDDGTGNLVPVIGNVSGTINYNTGEVKLILPQAATASSEVNATYGSGYSPTITYLEIKVGLMAGSPPISLYSVLVEISDGYTDATLTYNPNAQNFTDLTNRTFGVQIARDMPPSNWERDRVITSGDVIKILINASAVGLYLAPQTNVMIKLIPKHGVPNLVEFETPSTYTTKYINLW
ncbi:archaeal flagellin-like protein [Aciduliprofundum sp. MAR08-339]|uniref:archaellin/type IV pilin N-terminal domain-containing protein n=1 Tax=Aciduliprofundum sp. (strain MAR08-339) TaxID=673860 RepID=UPI0002A4AFCB|nr:archaeal flagellin-like protein [Aciduliprofundum sp. MAR08-339]